MRARVGRTRVVIAGVAAVAALASATVGARAAAWTPPDPTYQQNDYSGGGVLSILPPGEHGLYNASDIAAYEANSSTRPAGADDQLPQYANLLYNSAGLTDAQLPTYFNDESFGIPQGGITRTETPSTSVPVVIYRDKHEVPHIYADDRTSLAFGAGYAAAEDRLFLMDVLRHYGAGNLSAFLGPSCADEQMDHDALLLGGYSQAQKQAQIDAMPSEYGVLGQELKDAAYAYVAGINQYIAATQTDPTLLPADYVAAVGAPPQPWQVTDVIDIATLVGGIFGKGGGNETANAGLLRYLDAQVGAGSAPKVFADLRLQDDPSAPTTASSPFPYEQPGPVDPSKVAIPDSTTLMGGPTNTTTDCTLTNPNLPALGVIDGLLHLPTEMSNALLVDGAHSADGHPVAVIGPQVSYYTPQILMQEDMHAPDFDASGVSFPGTNFLVELGRGRNFAWSATSANTDNVDQVAEQVCDPNGGAPAAQGQYYLYKGVCTPMVHQNFTETAVTKPGGLGAPTIISHDIYYTVHGVVQGWTTVNGLPVAIVNERSTYNHEVDSGVGFLRWSRPSYTYDPASFMQGAGSIQYTFNWFYIDSQQIAYYQSGLDPIRAAGVDPNFPSWGTGIADWQGFLSFSGHPHQTGSPNGYIVSWNNKPAPSFGAADDNYTYGPVQRVQSLQLAIEAQFAAHGGHITRANLVSAMEQAASVDLIGTHVLPELLAALPAGQTAQVQSMVATLQAWLNDGALRRKAAPGDTQYADAGGVAIMDELYPRVVRAIFDNLLGGGGVSQQLGLDAAYNVLPEKFSQNPNQTGGSGSSYYGGLQSQVDKVLEQVNGESVAQPMSATTTSLLCGGGGLSACPALLTQALQSTFTTLAADNGGSTNPSTWTNNSETAAGGKTLPQLDAIHFAAVGLAGQPDIDWQNRPTYQQVVEFLQAAPVNVPETPTPLLLLGLPIGLTAVHLRRRRRALQR